MSQSRQGQKFVTGGLGIDENTLRHWNERGLIRSRRLSSRARPFRAGDVQTTGEQEFTGFAPLCTRSNVVPVESTRSID